MLLAQTGVEVGDDEAPLTANVQGDDVQIAFNARYMLDEALSALDSDEVQLSFNGLASSRASSDPSGRTTTSASSCRCGSA